MNILVFIKYMDENHPHHKEAATTRKPHNQYDQYDRLINDKPQTQRSNQEIVRRSPILLDLAAIRVNSSEYCPSYGESESKWQELGTYLFDAVDQTFDPCEDFYGFSCNKYIETTVEHTSKAMQAQIEVNNKIKAALDASEENMSDTEKITKKVVDACVKHIEQQESYIIQVLTDMKRWFDGIPFMGHTIKPDLNIFEVMGTIEQERSMATLIDGWVTYDHKHANKHVLYLSQPDLPMPREDYMVNQNNHALQLRFAIIQIMLTRFVQIVSAEPELYDENIKDAAKKIAKLEADMASASWSDVQMKNYAQRYNPYSVKELEQLYPNIDWRSYLNGLLSSVENVTQVVEEQVVLSQPSYFAWLNTMFNTTDTDTIVNYILLNVIFEDAEFLGNAASKIAADAKYVRYVERRSTEVTRTGKEFMRAYQDDDDPAVNCIGMVMAYMPYGPGYVYAKSLKNRDEIRKDVAAVAEQVIASFSDQVLSVDWMTGFSKRHARSKLHNLVTNIGWPEELFGDFSDSKAIDAYHEEDYAAILQQHDFYSMINTLRKGKGNRESYRLLVQPAVRTKFFTSPAIAKVSYVPERNSLTIPIAMWNPPYYRYDFPKAYNFAGLGGAIGHEMSHGFDEKGIQFADRGSLIGCTWMKCGWLPKLEQFTPNQIFWISYANSLCRYQYHYEKRAQLMSGPRVPDRCRTNQVVQDLTEFTMDFGCRPGQKMAPESDQRCKVWV
ncbi:unnamed protein product [Nippostrongylus brasiliensis]|uniref:Neprilysin-2 n=1 Tax=Nippostrongylus brasiliensis TaxID=27835 RepID=A0A0N4Y803_NIPBR|nr:unnamed protein product [Nippostrongylus brasiliensis]